MGHHILVHTILPYNMRTLIVFVTRACETMNHMLLFTHTIWSAYFDGPYHRLG